MAYSSRSLSKGIVERKRFCVVLCVVERASPSETFWAGKSPTLFIARISSTPRLHHHHRHACACLAALHVVIAPSIVACPIAIAAATLAFI